MIRAYMCILWKLTQHKHMSQVDNRDYLSPLNWRVVTCVPAISQHRDDDKNDMPWWLSVTVCMTIFNTGWQAVGNTGEISSYCHQLSKIITKNIPHLQLICPTVTVNTSVKWYLINIQWHLSRNVCISSSSLKINMPLFHSLQRPHIHCAAHSWTT